MVLIILGKYLHCGLLHYDAVSKIFIKSSKEHASSIIYFENADVINPGYQDSNMIASET
jgi:hypothetical protein